jgi:hypothetical protein
MAVRGIVKQNVQAVGVVVSAKEAPFVRASRPLWKRVALIATGWGLLTVGAAGVVLPFLPGWPLIAVGLVVLSSEYVWAHRVLQSSRRRFPKIHAAIDRRFAFLGAR